MFKELLMVYLLLPWLLPCPCCFPFVNVIFKRMYYWTPKHPAGFRERLRAFLGYLYTQVLKQ